MATWPTPALSDGTLVDEVDWNLHVDNLNDLNTRLGTGTATPLATRVSSLETRTISTTGGITGGGDLSANRTLSLTYGTAANTVAQGNDSRITITQDATIGNSALGTRVTALEGTVGFAKVTYVTTTISSGSANQGATLQLASISVANPGWNYKIWCGGQVGCQWDSATGWGNIAMQTSSTWGTGVIGISPFFAAVTNLKVTGTLLWQTDNVTYSGAKTLYFLFHSETANMNALRPGQVIVSLERTA